MNQSNGNQSRGGAFVAILLAFAALVVAFLAWLAPFSPIGPSPFAPRDIQPTLASSLSTEPTSFNVSVPTTEPSPATTTEPSPAATAESNTTILPQAGDIRTIMRGGVAVEQVFVPAGSFAMGEVYSSNSKPVHEVALNAFWADRMEVTNAQYASSVDVGVCESPSDLSSYTRSYYYGNNEYADYPVVHVSWSNAQCYCKWAGGRLPTEAEWEYVARGPSNLTYPWGDEQPSCELLNFGLYCMGDTTEVRSYSNGASWVGALNMAGNAWEWVYDWYDAGYYQNSPRENPTGPMSSEHRAVRGGSWYDVGDVVRSANRMDVESAFSGFNIGFRCVQD